MHSQKARATQGLRTGQALGDLFSCCLPPTWLLGPLGSWADRAIFQSPLSAA